MSQQESASIPPLLNRVMTIVLRSPLHRIASRSIMLITFTGRRSGKTYTTPISYTREGDHVTAFTHAKWSQNLEGGAPVTLNIKNKEYEGQADVEAEDKDAVAAALQLFLSKVRSDARFYDVQFDPSGEPNREDVQRAAQNTDMISIQLS